MSRLYLRFAKPASSTRWHLWVLAVLLLMGLPGCAGSMVGDDVATSSDESAVRHRAGLRLQLAAGYYERGQARVALDETKQALVIDPTFADAYNLRGLIYMQINEPSLAQESFRRALSLSRNNPDVLHNLGCLQCQQGQYVQAARSFTQALEQATYTGRAKTWLTQGLCQIRSGETGIAEQSLLQAYGLEADNPVTGYNLAQLFYARGETQRARFYIQRINSSALANSETLWLGAKIEHRLGNPSTRDRLVSQLRAQYPGSKELDSYDRRSFDE